MMPVTITGSIEQWRDRLEVPGSAEASFNPVATIHTPAHDEFAFINLRHLSHKTAVTATTAH